uniref:Uncharacterized protein n=1 Tax=Picornavirales sp. TaxID=1955153 RepID=A0A6M3YPK6_9VIRU|nr:MAG: hypothetical protein 2 [Picornavirales sp.]
MSTINDQPIEETLETVTFYNDKASEDKTINDAVPLPMSLDEATIREVKKHEIRNFLARPILLETLTWSTSSVANSLIGGWTNPSVLFAQANNRTKIAGFFGYKGTMVVTITVNGTRFMQGLLLLHYFPQKALVSTSRYNVAQSNLIFKTQQPHIVYDIATDSEVSLAIPWIHIKPYLEIAKGEELGDFYVSVYSPLISVTGDTTASVNVWAHLEDVDLEFPGVMISQSGRPVRRSRGGKETQGGSSVQDRELTRAGVGPVSGLFGKISGAAGVLSAIPSISAIAGPASWLSAILSDAAAAAGWSNPSQSAPIGKMMPARLAFAPNVDGVDNSIKMSASADNQVEAMPGFGGNDDDELSISRIVRRPAYFVRFSYDTAVTAGTRIWGKDICPLNMGQMTTLTTVGSKIAQLWLNTPLSYVAGMFAMWRGSVCIKFRLVKTEFHSGRLLVAFSPGSSAPPTTIAQTTNLYREVYDIADSNEITICVPYVSTKPWSRMIESIGNVTIFVLSSLRAPATVSSSITLIGEAWGGDDMQFAVPQGFRDGVPIQVAMAAQSAGLTPQDFEAYMADLYPRPMISQGLGVNTGSNRETADMAMMPEGFASCVMGKGDLAPQRFCSGEAILSLRQLLKRATLYLSSSAGNAELEIDAFNIYMPFLSATVVDFDPNWHCDYYSYIGTCFAMGRGGIRLKVFQPGSTGDITVRGYVGPRIQAPIGSNVHTPSTPMGDVIVSVKTSMSGAAEVEIPQYTDTFARPHYWAPGLGQTSNAAAGFAYGSPFRQKWTFNDKDTKVLWLRQGADDTDFGCFIGVLPTLGNLGTFVTYPSIFA